MKSGFEESKHDGKKFFIPKKPFPHGFKEVLKWRLLNKRPKWPKKIPPLPTQEIPKKLEENLQVTYIGHATFLIQASKLNILTDPVFSERASPFKWMGPKRVQPPGVPLSKLPKIDMIFVSHNHYDHLDLPSLKKIWKRDKPIIITPLGNEKILRKVNRHIQIQTLDWNEVISLPYEGTLKLLPAQHWSARSLFDRNQALWGSAWITLDKYKILFIGDTGFDPELFKHIKKENGAPDLVMLPIGSYAPRWLMSYSHMNPEEAWDAFHILKGKYLIPSHYDIFQLGNEPFGEALSLLKKAAGKHWDQVLPLKPGEGVHLT